MSSLPPDFDYGQLNDRKYKAHDFEVHKDLEHGPLEKRRCTDVLCFIIFFSWIGCVLFMSIYGWINGNISEILAPVDG
jgi:hypothetical protein